MRLIDGDELLEHVWRDRLDTRERIANLVKFMPTIKPQRIKGRWERKESELTWWYECSECGESPLFDPYENEVLTRFCPWCGTEMRGDEDE